MAIKKVKAGYKVTDKSGKKTLGTHKTKKAALSQLAAIKTRKKK